MKQTTKWNQFESKEDLYLPLKLALWDTSHQKKRHKAYFLFSVLFLKAWWLKNNLFMVRKAVRNNTLDQIREKRHPDVQDDDNIDIYFIDEGNGKFFIVLLYNPCHYHRGRSLLGIIPVRTNDYKMTKIYPLRAKTNRKITTHRKTHLTYSEVE